MRRLVICLGVITILTWAVSSAAQTSAAVKSPAAKADHRPDDLAIAKLLENTQTAFNNHDAKGIAASSSEDGDMRDPDGTIIKGRAKMAQLWSERFAGMYKNLKVTIHPATTIRYIGSTIAVMDTTADTSGLIGPDGKELPASTLLVTNVLVKRNGSWQVLAQRAWPMNAVPGPAPARRPTS